MIMDSDKLVFNRVGNDVIPASDCSLFNAVMRWGIAVSWGQIKTFC